MPELEERIAVLEADFRNAKAKIDSMSEKVDEMHEMLIDARGQARGAKIAFWLMSGLAGVIGSKLATFLGLLNSKM